MLNHWAQVGLGFGGGEGEGAHSRPAQPQFMHAVRGNMQLSAAAHYNNRIDTHRRIDSKIDTLQQKNLNNWIKSLLINSAVVKNYSVLDFACGKGGDLQKWSRRQIRHYVGIDIAHTSVLHAIQR